MTLPVTVQAAPHRVPHGNLGNRHLLHFPMARLALNFCPGMRSVLEPDLSARVEPVESVPRDFAFLFRIFKKLLHTRPSIGELRMTQHAFAKGWYSRLCARVHRDVTIYALQALGSVFVVGKFNRLPSAARRQANR